MLSAGIMHRLPWVLQSMGVAGVGELVSSQVFTGNAVCKINYTVVRYYIYMADEVLKHFPSVVIRLWENRIS